jgi:hypothetical protein
MGGGHYILIGQTPVLEPDLLTWAEWFEHSERHVMETFVGPFRVSTVFLGLDHSFSGGRPILFETMTFLFHGGRFTERCGTWLEAEQQHQAAVAVARRLWRHPFLILGWLWESCRTWFAMRRVMRGRPDA